jgi:aerobic carbon-monoxide dehydrogenase medium subunit
MYPFKHHRPAALDQALALFAQAEDGKYLAGGMTLIPTLKQRLAAPSDLIDLGRLDALAAIAEETGGLRIGALARHAAVADDPLVRRLLPGLAQLAGVIGDAQVRSRGTIGGSIANADPAADYPAGLVALGATVRTNVRDIAAEDFFTGFFETALEPGELVASVFFPAPQRGAYAKFRNPASGYAVVGAFVAAGPDGPRVAITGAAGSVFRWTEAETALAGSFSPDALAGLSVSPDEMNDDLHASAAYRAHLVQVMTRKAVAACQAA